MTSSTRQNIDLDTKLLADFIYALNIVRRQVQSYPTGHPMVATATRNLVEVVPRLLEFRERITLGIARDTLLVDGAALDASNPVYRDLAKSLFDAQVASLTIERTLTEEEIYRFFDLYRSSPGESDADAGLENRMKEAGIRGISVQGVDFSAFSTTEQDVVHAPKTKVMESDAVNLWKSFAVSLAGKVMGQEGEKGPLLETLDPVLLADILNREMDEGGRGAASSYEEAITGFLKAADQKTLRDRAYQQTLGRLGDMATKLKPELRRKFLNSMLKNCAGRPETAEGLFGTMPPSLLLDAIEEVDAGQLEIPQTLLDVLGRLSMHREKGTSTARVVGTATRSADEAADQLAKLFTEDRSEFFVPQDYQDALAVMATAQSDPFLDALQTEELFNSLKANKIEEHFCCVLLDLACRDVEGTIHNAISENLAQSLRYFLETGDVPSILKIHDVLSRAHETNDMASATAIEEALTFFSTPDFTAAILDGFDSWDKSAQPELIKLIVQIGPPFIVPLLDRLADEPSMARRRVYMECLVHNGSAVIDPIAARLGDERWYFVRNLVLVLRELKDPAVAPVLERLVRHQHPKVQNEVMQTLLRFGNQNANLMLCKALSGKNPAALLNAVRLAVNTRDARTINLLAKVLNTRLPAEHEFEIKSSAIKSLEKVVTEAELPEIARFLKGKKLFGGSRSQSLKIAVLAVLEKLVTVDAGILAGEVAQMSTGELAKRAEDVLVKIHGELL